MFGTDCTGKETICPIHEEKKKRTWKHQLSVCERLSRNKGQIGVRPVLSSDFMDEKMEEELKVFDSVKLSPKARINTSTTSPPPEICWVHPPQEEDSITETKFLDAFLKQQGVEVLSGIDDEKKDEIHASKDEIQKDDRKSTSGTPEEEKEPLPNLESILWGAFEGQVRIHNPLHGPDRDLIVMALRDQIPVHFHREIKTPVPEMKEPFSPTSSCALKSIEPLLTTGYDMHVMQGKIRKDRIYRALPSCEEQRDPY